MNPDPFTLRELTWMMHGRGKFQWAMTAHQMALQINMNRKKGTKAVTPDALNPFIRRKSKRDVVSAIHDVLKKVFCKNKG